METKMEICRIGFETAWPRWTAHLSRWIVTLCIFALVGSASACARGQDSTPTAPAKSGDNVDRSVVVTVRTSLSVDNVVSSSEKVRKLVEQHDGVVANANTYGRDSDRNADFELRIPAAKLEAFRAGLHGVGELDSESEQVEDVTAPHADLAARLGTACMQEKRLLALLEQKSGSLADVVAIEKELASVRENIERMEAEQRILDRRISFATVNVSLRPAHTNLWAHPVDAIVGAFETGLRGARNLVIGGAIVLAAALPSVVVIALAAALIFSAVRALLRRRTRRAVATS